MTWRPMPAAARSKLCSSASAWLGVYIYVERVRVKDDNIKKLKISSLTTHNFTISICRYTVITETFED